MGMPILSVESNVELDKSSRLTMMKDLSALVAELLQKPEERVYVRCHLGVDMIKGGSDEPCAIVQLNSVGCITEELNPQYSAKLSEMLKKHLNVQPARAIIYYVDMPPTDVGSDGTTISAKNRA